QHYVTIRAKDPARLAAARRRLVEYGIPEERLGRFPPEQVILLDERREYEVRRDEETKHLKLPLWEIEALNARPKPKLELCLFDAFTAAFDRVRLAQARLDQRIALLRHVEALRLYAA